MQQPQQPSASGQYGVPEVPQFVGGRSSDGHMLGISHDMPHHEPPQSQHLQQQQLLQQSHSQPPQQQSVNPQVKTDSITEIQSSAATRPIPRTTDGFEQMVPNSAFGDDEVLAAAEDGDRGSVGSRWLIQETLALLKIRSEMDASFRDASLKGPLWEEISRYGCNPFPHSFSSAVSIICGSKLRIDTMSRVRISADLKHSNFLTVFPKQVIKRDTPFQSPLCHFSLNLPEKIP